MGIKRGKHVIVLLVAVAAFMCAAASQNAPITGEGFVSIGEQLQRRHIPLTMDSLIGALKNPDATVRGLAAAKLDEDSRSNETDETAAIPALDAALAAEKDLEAKRSIASALARLGDSRGAVALKDMCHDSSLSGQIRAEAGEFLLGTGSEDCHDAVASIALVGDGVARQRALVALESFRQLSQKERAGDVEIMCRGLTDADSGVRLEASEALGCFGEISGIQCLRDAIVHEPEDHVRSSMQRAIDKLDKVGRTDSTKEKPRGNPGDVQDK